MLGVRGLRLPGDSLSFRSLPRQLKRAPYNNVLSILVNFLCALVNFLVNPLRSLVDAPLYRYLPDALAILWGAIHDAYLVVRDGIN